jgi:hypothetical protein
MNGIVSRFLNFDKLIATGLIKFLYWIGLIGVGIYFIIALFGAFSAFQLGFAQGIGALVLAPITAIIGLIFWRFICEVYLVIFGIYDRLGNIQKAVGGGEPKDISSVAD